MGDTKLVRGEIPTPDATMFCKTCKSKQKKHRDYHSQQMVFCLENYPENNNSYTTVSLKSTLML